MGQRTGGHRDRERSWTKRTGRLDEGNECRRWEVKKLNLVAGLGAWLWELPEVPSVRPRGVFGVAERPNSP
ncbi:MAG: hypothetical protein QM784_33950 [Polyangiaceae bacterium]